MDIPWTPEEEKILRETVPLCGSWEDVARKLPKRSGNGCRSKWTRMQEELKLGEDIGKVEVEETPPAIARFMDSPEFDAEAFFDVIEELQGLVNRADPITVYEPIEIETELPIAVMFTSCWHLGGRYVFYRKFRDLLRMTLEIPRVYWGVHGDLGDFFLPSFRNAEPVLTQLIHPQFQRKLAAHVLGQLAEEGRLLYGCAGNHEDFLTRVIGEDLMKPEFQSRHIPYFVGKGVVRLTVGEENYILGVSHQWPGHSYFNPTHPEIRALMVDLPGADIIAGGHLHGFAHQEIAQGSLAHEAGVLQNQVFHAVAIGTASCGPDPYSIKRWTRGAFEWPCFCFYPDRHEIKRIYDWDDMEYFLSI